MIFPRVVATELTKLRRSKVTWVSLAVYAVIVVIAGAFLWMVKNPEVARSIGLVGQKAQFAFGGQPVDWSSFMSYISVMGGVGGLIMCSVIVSYVFGREYVEGTAKNMLCLPTPRSYFVFAKIIVSALWFLLLNLWMIAVSYAVGTILGLGGLTSAIFLTATGQLLRLALMSLCCSLLVAWIAVESRGYFAPLGFSIGTMALASVFGRTGWAPWVPWSIVGLASGVAGPDTGLSAGSYLVIIFTFLLGTALVIRHEVFADNKQ
jgi:ABC-2 type transport system permease protein